MGPKCETPLLGSAFRQDMPLGGGKEGMADL